MYSNMLLNVFIDVPFLFFRQTDLSKFIITKETDKKEEKESKKEYFICRTCKHIITTPENVISIAGTHRHTFKNPSGIIYQIGCFSNAEGCMDVGEPTLEYTWFPGFAWRISICSGCMNHLGWSFDSGGKIFYGLIIDRITKNI